MYTRRREGYGWVNRAQTAAEKQAIRCSTRGGRSYGSEAWVRRTMGRLTGASPVPCGRPWKKKK
jgi:hypothetical protein